MHVGAKMSTQAARALLLVLVLTLAIAGLTPRAQAQEALLAGAPSSPVAVFQPLTRDRPIFASFGGPSGFSAPIVVGAPPATDLQVVGNARGDAIAIGCAPPEAHQSQRDVQRARALSQAAATCPARRASLMRQ